MNAEQVRVVESGEANFEADVLQADQATLVVFWAPWSRPCQAIQPVLGELAHACAETSKVVRVNLDEHPGLGRRYEIDFIPTWVCFVAGNERARAVGPLSKEAILSKMLSQAGPNRTGHAFQCGENQA